MTKNVLDMTTGLQVFTAETGLNTRALQQWQQVSERVGLSGDVATQAISRISQLLGGLKAGYGDPQALGALGRIGVNLSGSAYDVMNSLQAASMKQKPEVVSQMLAAAGLSPELLRLFSVSRQTREAIRPTMTTGDQTAMAELTKELAIFNRQVMGEFVKALVSFEPYMADFTAVLILLLQKFSSVAGSTIGETSRFIMGIHRQGGFLNFMDNLDNSMAPVPKGNYGHPGFTYNGGDSTYNITGMLGAEALARTINEERMRHETLEHTAAMKLFNNQGAP